MRREGWLALLTLIWVAGGLAALIRSELPRGRVVGKVIAIETGQALPKAEIWFESKRGSWRVRSKWDGSFELPNLPAGTYTVTASTYAHRLSQTSFTLNEGETRNLLIALEPVEPFLELIHPQTVFHPDENVKVGIRGFVATDELRIQVWKVRLEKATSKVPLTTVLRFLDEVREGWWRGVWELKEELQRISPCLVKVSETQKPISQRDVEGVFLQFLPVSLNSEGIYLVRVSSEDLERIALVELTKVGLIVKLGRDLDNNPIALAYTADLKTGEPVSGVKVTAWVSERIAGREMDRKIAASVTDANGMARLPLGKLNLDNSSACFFIVSKPNAGEFYPVAWVKMEEYELRDAMRPSKMLSGVIYTDRPVYRPGNLVHFKGIVREQTAKGYQLPNPMPFTLLVRDPDGNTIHRTDVTLTDFGSFSGSLTLNEESPTGTYTIEAVPKNGTGASNRIVGTFTVAAYRKPEIQVTVKPSRSRFSRSDTVTITVTARYYFGMPVAGAEVSYWVTRLPVVDEYEGAEWGEGYGGETILEGETRTDANGQATIRFRPTDLTLGTPPFSEFRYEVYVTVEAAGYQFAEGTASFLVTQGDWKLTIWCEPSFVSEKQTVTAKAKVVHWDTKKPQANAIVHWRAGWVEWIGREDMKIRWQLQGQSKTDENGETQWQFVPSETGDWVVEATVYDPKRNTIGAETSVWVVSRTRAPTLPPKLPPIQLLLDKPRYQIGEEAKVAIQSKLKNAAVLVTVEGEKLYAARLLRLRNGTAEWEIPLSSELLPNAYVTASLVHQKKFVEQVKPIRFELDDFRLQVSVKSDREVYEPRQTARLTVQVRDSKGNPVKAELSIAVVDEAIYAIKSDDPEQVFRAFYSERPNRTVTRYSFPWLAWQGDKGKAETVRKYFPDTALWLPHVITDENGTAQVQLAVPDTLTQWRVTAIAHTLDTNVGYGVTKFRCTKPFGVRIAAPIVLTQGDQTTVSAIVHNDTERGCEAKVEVEFRHLALGTGHFALDFDRRNISDKLVKPIGQVVANGTTSGGVKNGAASRFSAVTGLAGSAQVGFERVSHHSLFPQRRTLWLDYSIKESGKFSGIQYRRGTRQWKPERIPPLLASCASIFERDTLPPNFGARLGLHFNATVRNFRGTDFAGWENAQSSHLFSSFSFQLTGVQPQVPNARTSAQSLMPSAQIVTIPPHKTANVNWKFIADKVGKWMITVKAKSSDGRADAEQRVIVVLPHATERLVSRTLMVSPEETEQVLRVVLPPNTDLETSQIHVRLAPSIFSAMLGALEYLATYPYGCVEQTMNGFLPDLLVWRVLKERGIKIDWLEKELPRMVNRGLARLYRFQHDDGGWGWWEDDPTDLWMTALVVRGLAEAKKAGFEVSEQVLRRGIKALERMVQEKWRERDKDTVAFALFALARAGAKLPALKPTGVFTPASVPNSQPQLLASIIDHCSPYGLAFLTLALHEWKHPQAMQVAKKLLMTALPLREDLRWAMSENFHMRRWTTGDEITAWALLALMRVGSVDARSATATVRTLLQNRKGAGWISTKDTAAVLEAILEFSKRFETIEAKAPVTVNISLNGSSQIVQIPPNGASLPETTVKLIGNLKVGVNEVKVTKPKGVTLWVTLVNRQSLILPERFGELLSSEQRVQRRYEKLTPYIGDDGQVKWKAKPLRSGDSVKVGDVVRVTLTVDCPTNFMVLEDPIPAGMRVVEGRALGIERGGYWGGEIKPKEVRDDRTITYFRGAGRHVVRYLLRAEVPGDYHILPPRLWHMYGTERWNGAEERLRVLP